MSKYGYLKQPFQNPRSSKDIAMDTGMSAISGAQQGAQIGSAFGPTGAAIGAGVGLLGMGANALISGRDAQKKESANKSNVEAINRGVDKLDRMGEGFNKNVMTTAYENGGISDGSNAEVRHSEIILDKDYNFKNIIPNKSEGGKTHKEGGHDVDLQDGDIVLPSKTNLSRRSI